MQNTINQTKAGLDYICRQLEHVLACTPDERLNWSPSSTARTPLEVAAHIAMSVTGIQLMLEEKPRLMGEFGKGAEAAVVLTGKPGEIAYPFETVADIDVAFRAEEKKFKTREAVMELMNSVIAEFKRWLDTLTPEQFDSILMTAFGPVPMSFGITLVAMHSGIHISQIEYIQTIYGDMDRHPL